MKGYTALTIALLLCSTTYIRAQEATGTETTTAAATLTADLPTNCKVNTCIQCVLTDATDTAGSCNLCAKSQIAVVGDTKKNNCEGSGLLEGCLATQMNAAGTAECVSCNMFEGYFASKGEDNKPTECTKCDMLTQYFDKEAKACKDRTTKSSGTVCKTKDSYKDECTTCNDSNPLFSGTCTSLTNCAIASEAAKCGTCKSKFYADENGKCQACPANTSSCTSATAFTCMAASYKTEDNKSCVACGANASTCNKDGILTCKTGFYLKDKACTACGTGMKTCDASGNAVTCLDGHFKKDTKCEASAVANCMTGIAKDDCRVCKNGFYPTNSLAKCTAFTVSKCAEGTWEKCTKCEAGYFLIGTGTAAKCGKHDENCMTPSFTDAKATGVAGSCTACKKGFYLTSTGNDGAGLCTACNSNVDQCDKDKATKCDIPDKIINGKDCVAKANGCTAIAENKCTKCGDGFFVASNPTDNNHTCQSCTGTTTPAPNTIVLTCDNASAHKTCADGGFVNTSTNKCETCEGTTFAAATAKFIKTCTKAGTTVTVTECIKGSALSGTTPACDASGASIPCLGTDGTTANPSGTTCKFDGSAYSYGCPDGYFKAATTGICTACSSTTNTNVTGCTAQDAGLTCETGYFVSGTQCTMCDSSGDGTRTPDTRASSCSTSSTKCHDTTDLIVASATSGHPKECKFINNCKNKKSDDSECAECDDGYFLATDKLSCSECSNAGDATCESNTKALTCKAGYIKEGDACNQVSNCETTSQTACTKCNSGYYIKDKKCTKCPDNSTECSASGPSKCATGFRLDSTTTPATCKACTDANAATCSATEATTCKDTYFILDKKCTAINGNCATTSSTKREKLNDIDYVNCTKCDAGYYLDPVKSTCNALKSNCKLGNATSCTECMNEMDGTTIKTTYELNAANTCVVTKRGECKEFDETNKLCKLCAWDKMYFATKVTFTSSISAQTCTLLTLEQIKAAGGSSGYLSAFYAISALFIMIFLR